MHFVITYTVIEHCLIMFVDKDFETKIQELLTTDQECYSETEVYSFMIKVLV